MGIGIKQVMVVLGILALIVGVGMGENPLGGLFLFIAILISLMAHFIQPKIKVPEPTPQITPPEPPKLREEVEEVSEPEPIDENKELEKRKVQVEQEMAKIIAQMERAKKQQKQKKKQIICPLCEEPCKNNAEYMRHLGERHPDVKLEIKQ